MIEHKLYRVKIVYRSKDQRSTWVKTGYYYLAEESQLDAMNAVVAHLGGGDNIQVDKLRARELDGTLLEAQT